MINTRQDLDALPADVKAFYLKMLWSQTIDSAGSRKDAVLGYSWQELDALFGVPEKPISPVHEPEPQAPQAITRRQALLMLDTLGKYQQVSGFVAQSTDAKIRIEYEASIWLRNSPVLTAMAKQLLNMTDADINAFFTAASQL